MSPLRILRIFFMECLIGVRQIGMKKMSKTPSVTELTPQGKGEKDNEHIQETSSSHRALMKIKLMRKTTML